MKITLIQSDKIYRVWNNEIPQLFIKPKKGVVKIVESNGTIYEYDYVAHKYEDMVHDTLDIIETNIVIAIGELVWTNENV